MTTDAVPQPVRRAIVSLFGGSQPLGRHTITDDEGRFEFEALPAAKYEISAARPSFVPIAYGATRPGRPGTPLAVKAGQSITGVLVLLARGAVITGVVRDAEGDPITGIEVRVERSGINAAMGKARVSVVTDDQGVYRAYGLAAGSYVVSARPPSTGGVSSIPTDAEVDVALRELQRRRGVGSPNPSGVPSKPATARAAGPDATARVHDLVPVYHPSVFTQEETIPVTVATGEERSAIDVTVQMMSTSTVAGQIQTADGRLPPNVHLSLTKASAQGTPVTVTTTVQKDGTFRFSSVTPGRYLVVARAMSQEMVRASLGFPPTGIEAASVGPCSFAAQNVTVNGSDITDLSLTVKPCFRITGRVEFVESALKRPPNFTAVRLTWLPDVSTGTPMLVPSRVPPAVAPDGTFLLGEWGEVLPGSYHFRAELTGSEPGRGWWMQTATADGRDILDAPLEISPDNPATINVIFAFTDRHTSLSGVLQTASGQAATDYTILVFTVNREWWRPPFRRVATTRPATDGQYVFNDLPPGEYYLAAMNDFAPDDWRDPTFLAEAVSASL
ncbi:MAG TPA: carboxypeptidase-like regulatory domain-containing protein, partial [Vicinamibacterales bacterium]